MLQEIAEARPAGRVWMQRRQQIYEAYSALAGVKFVRYKRRGISDEDEVADAPQVRSRVSIAARCPVVLRHLA